jgi:hypothetical protein
MNQKTVVLDSEVLAEHQDNPYDKAIDDYLLQRHLEDLLNCSTSWIVWKKLKTSSSKPEYSITSNYCNNRNCPVCQEHRLIVVRKRIRQIFKKVNRINLITLTFGKNVELTRETKKLYHSFWYNYRRRVLKNNPRFAGVICWEYKKQANGLYHIHCHIASITRVPHHLLTSKLWAETIGTKARTDTKYHLNKSRVINYFAKRVSEAGMDKTPQEYLAWIKRSHLYNSFGPRAVISSTLVLRSQKLNTVSDDSSYFLVVRILSIDKMQCETIPPPIDTLLERIHDNEKLREGVPCSGGYVYLGADFLTLDHDGKPMRCPDHSPIHQGLGDLDVMPEL